MRRPKRTNRTRHTGFTLLEVILVIVLLGVLFAYALPRVSGHVEATGLSESADRLRSLIHLTRAAAMRDGVRYRLAFPGAPDPDDPNAERIVEVSESTQQPYVEREEDPVNRPGEFGGADLYYDVGGILVGGVRCVSVRLGQPNFDINDEQPFAGPEINGWEAPLDTVTFNPDGTCDWATFTITNLHPDVEPEEKDITRALHIYLDGRTGQVWFQRPLRNTEIEIMNEYGASPVLHMDFLDTTELTEDNILYIHSELQVEGVPRSSGSEVQQSAPAEGSE